MYKLTLILFSLTAAAGCGEPNDKDTNNVVNNGGNNGEPNDKDTNNVVNNGATNTII